MSNQPRGIWAFASPEADEKPRPEHSQTHQQTKGTESTPQPTSGSAEELLFKLLDVRIEETRTQAEADKHKAMMQLIAEFLVPKQTETNRPNSLIQPEEIPVVDIQALIAQTEANSEEITIEEYEPQNRPKYSQTFNKTSRLQSVKEWAKETATQHKKRTAILSAGVMIATGVVVNNNIEGGLLPHVPIIGSMFKKPTPPTQEQVQNVAEQLVRQTTIEKPLTDEAIAIGKVEAPATEPEISLGVNYSTVDESGKELTIANSVRMAAIKPYLQINYRFIQENLVNSLKYDEQTATLTIDPSAIDLQFLMLAAPNSSGAVNSASPEFAYRIAGAVGDNEAILGVIKKQQKDFSASDIKTFMNALANPANETYISDQITAETYKQLLSDPLFIQALTDNLNSKVASDIAKLQPGLKLQPIVLSPEFINSTIQKLTSRSDQTKLTDGLSVASNIKGLNPPDKLS
jgi:hypothetical protein